ncbi:hypothetical protein [Clostridium sp. DJ247]|uniref:hypothetical protein n=1 Tax=Clostridium sp. DJ247 TaxID=2726188 RepID=UPI0016269EBE|nr:hypothetical protein [Clostridium sp. DJ247]MBC2580314.1 hypothetical protein [Clostridium sp. DJ247]
MIRRRAVLEISEEKLTYREISKKNILSKGKVISFHGETEIAKNNFGKLIVNLKDKNLSIVVNDEEVYIKLITIPRVPKERIYFIIKNELAYRFKNVSNIIFSYQIVHHKKDKLEVMVFCLNWNKSNLINRFAEEGIRIEKLVPVQFHIIDNYSKRIKEKEYGIIFLREKSLYFVGCVENKMITNKVISIYDNLQDNIFIDELEKFKIKCSVFGFENELTNLFFLNFPYKELVNSLSESYNCNYLEYNEMDVLR